MVFAAGSSFHGKQELDEWLMKNTTPDTVPTALDKTHLNRFVDWLEHFFPELSLLPSDMATRRLREPLSKTFSATVVGVKHTVVGFKFMHEDANLTRYATYAALFHVEEESGPIHLTIYCARLPEKTTKYRNDTVSFATLEALINYFRDSTWDHAVCLRLSCQKYIGGQESPVLVLNRPRDWNLTSIASQFTDIIRSIMPSLRKEKD